MTTSHTDLSNLDIIQETISKVSETHGTAEEKIYQRLFSLHPEFLPLFDLDVDGGVRKNMLLTSTNCILGVAEGKKTTAHSLIQAARMIHDGYGIDDAQIDSMFVAMRDTYRDILGTKWTNEMENTWSALLLDLRQVGYI